MKRPLILLSVVLLPLVARADRDRPVADTIFFNASVETLDASFTRASALAVAGGRILAIGDHGDVMPHAGPGTRKVNLHGAALLPGWVDPHNHMFLHAEDLGLTLDEVQQQLIERGVTTMGQLFVNKPHAEDMIAFNDTGRLRIRTSLYLVMVNNCGEVRPPFFKEYPPSRDPLARLRFPGVKIFSDGGSCLHPATTFEIPIPGEEPSTGDLFFDVDDLYGMIAEAHLLGYQVAVHAIGDRARDVTFEAYERVLQGQPNVLRHRIEHSNWVRPDQIARYVSTGILANGYVERICEYNAGLTPRVIYMPEFAHAWWHPWVALLAAGVNVSWKSDWPGLPPNPLEQLYNLVTRKEVAPDGGICEPPAWMAAIPRPSTAQALRLMTSAGAYALHMDSVVGTLEVGKLADLIVLSDDPMDVDPDELKDLRLLSTVMDGESLWCAPGSEALCH